MSDLKLIYIIIHKSGLFHSHSDFFLPTKKKALNKLRDANYAIPINIHFDLSKALDTFWYLFKIYY